MSRRHQRIIAALLRDAERLDSLAARRAASMDFASARQARVRAAEIRRAADLLAGGAAGVQGHFSTGGKVA